MFPFLIYIPMQLPIFSSQQISDYITRLKSRQLIESDELTAKVTSIMREVKSGGDQAVNAFTRRFDQAEISTIRIPKSVIQDAVKNLSPEINTVLTSAIENIRTFHRHQLEKSWMIEPKPGVHLGQKISAIEKAGVYVPGGKAFYPSSILMNIIPAQIAGVKRIVVVTPPQQNGTIHPLILATCGLLDAYEIYAVGGAQAIAALTYGTESIPQVDMIVGPGNQYVAKAKQLAFGLVKIDSIAGPSEVTIVADESADPHHVAIDLFSQAEHDEMAAVTLISHSLPFIEKVNVGLPQWISEEPRKEIIEKSLKNYGGIIHTSSIEESISIANQLAPEHLELAIMNPETYLPLVENAGAVFLGHFAPEAMGDYFAGPNHVLPTCGTARFFSPLGVYDFLKRTSVIRYEKSAFEKEGNLAASFADLEGLSAHAHSIRVRLPK